MKSEHVLESDVAGATDDQVPLRPCPPVWLGVVEGFVKDDRRDSGLQPALATAATSVAVSNLRVMRGRLHDQYRPEDAGAVVWREEARVGSGGTKSPGQI
jgi:hypothetical protein